MGTIIARIFGKTPFEATVLAVIYALPLCVIGGILGVEFTPLKLHAILIAIGGTAYVSMWLYSRINAPSQASR